MQQPNPGQTAECDFEAASPVHSKWIRIGTLPRIPLRKDLLRIGFVIGKQPGLRQRDQVLMTAQLPRDLVISDPGKIEKVDPEPRYQRCAQTMHCIEMPVDFGPVVEVPIPQESEP